MKEFFYEWKHDISADYFTLEEAKSFSFPLHMHRCYEMILLREGRMRVRIEREEYLLEAGDLVLIKPNRIHSLETVGRSHHKLCIFSPELIQAVSPLFTKHPLSTPVIRAVPPLYRALFDEAEESAAIGGIKGFLYLLCDLFCKNLDLTREEGYSGRDQLIRQALRYVEGHVQEPCFLSDVAEALGYSDSYLSRAFAEAVGMSLSSYVRQVKINYACYLLKNTQASVTEIVNQCGYASVATFNHNFKALTGQSPTEYRKRHQGRP